MATDKSGTEVKAGDRVTFTRRDCDPRTREAVALTREGTVVAISAGGGEALVGYENFELLFAGTSAEVRFLRLATHQVNLAECKKVG